MRGRSVRQLALDSGYSDGQAIHLTLRCRHWPAVERAVADFIGVPLHELWPERYTQDDQPRPECRSRLHTGDQ
jgi:lambda repressor-like predicted transcriptional regulator